MLLVNWMKLYKSMFTSELQNKNTKMFKDRDNELELEKFVDKLNSVFKS